MSKVTVAEKLSAIGNNMARVYDTGHSEGYTKGYKDSEDNIAYLNERLENTLYGTDTGGKSFYDAFWDDFQKRGTRDSYLWTFAKFTDDIFYPKYDIKPTANATGMFGGTYVTDLTKRLIDCGVVLDTSRASNLAESFGYAPYLTRVPTVSAISTNGLSNIFASDIALIEVEKLILKSDGSQSFNNAFWDCINLQNIVFEGVIGQAINFQRSTKLTKASIESIITHLSDTASGKTLTLSLTAVNNAFATDEWNSLIKSKSNWTISLV